MPATTTVLLGAGDVSGELVADVGEIRSARIPVGGHSALSRVLRDVVDSGPVRILLDSRDAYLRPVLDNVPGVTVVLGESRWSLGAAVAAALSGVETASARIVFADTLGTRPLDGDAIGVHPAPDADRWTTVARAADGRLDFWDKGSHGAIGDAVVGAFAIADVARFGEVLEQHLSAGTPAPFWATWRDYDAARDGATAFVPCPGWRDVGHVDTYFAARRALLDSRAFNHLQENSGMGTVTKSGDRAEKIRDEADWMAALPDSLAHLVPRSYSARRTGSGYEVDFVPAITVGEALVFGGLDDGYWSPCERAIDDALALLASVNVSRPPAAEVVAAQRLMLLDKVRERVDALGDWADDLRGGARVNGRAVLGIDAAVSLLAERVQAALDADRWGAIHGDLFPGNMLFDRRSSRLLLIDPRGSFGRPGIEGDPLYDVAKLSHSIRGQYDFLAADQFVVRADGTDIDLLVARPDEADRVLDRLGRWLDGVVDQRGWDRSLVGAVEAGLLLSAAALHTESPARQRALVARGLVRMTEAAG